MAQKKVRAAIVSQEKLAEGIFSMWLDAPEMAEASRPGQFIAVYTNDPSKLLPRPISICEADKEKGRLRIVYRIAGAGTLEFSGYQAGDTLSGTIIIYPTRCHAPLFGGLFQCHIVHFAPPQSTL